MRRLLVGGAVALVVLAGLTSCNRLNQVIEVEAGSQASCAVHEDGTISCWGKNGTGQLGDGTTTSRPTPAAVSGIADARSVAMGWTHTCALHSLGTVSCWGANFAGQLGFEQPIGPPTTTPTPIPDLTGVVQLSAGGNRTCATLDDGTVRCWGETAAPNGDRPLLISVPTPTPVAGVSDAIAVETSEAHACAVIADGSVRCWGANDEGQLGDGTTETRVDAQPVLGLSDAVGVTAASQGKHSCALERDGSVACWGLNEGGALGDGTTTPSSIPVPVAWVEDAVEIGAAPFSSCARLTSGAVTCWGTPTPRGPQPIVATGATSISIGFGHSFAIVDRGRVICWGLNRLGQLGDGTMENPDGPVYVIGRR